MRPQPASSGPQAPKGPRTKGWRRECVRPRGRRALREVRAVLLAPSPLPRPESPPLTFHPETPTTSPWETHATKVVYVNDWMSLREDQVTTPTGTEGVYGVVSKPLALGVVAIDDEDNVVLIGQWRYPHDRWSWELPEGGLDEGEEPLAGIKRELAEEAGLAADSWEELTPRPIALSNSVTDEVARLWLATDLRPHEVDSDDPTEDLLVARVPFDEAVAACLDGRIEDAMTVLGLLLVERQRRG